MTYLADTDADDPLGSLQAASCTYRIALGPRAGQKVLSLRTVAGQDEKPRKVLCADAHGFSLQPRCVVGRISQLTGQLNELEGELASLRDEASQFSAQAELYEAWTTELDVQLLGIDEQIRLGDSRVVRLHEQIVGHEATVEQNHARGSELCDISRRYRVQLAAMTGRVGDLRERLRETTSALESSDSVYRDVGQRVASLERRLSDIIRQLDERRAEVESLRMAHMEQLRQSAACGNRISGLESQCPMAPQANPEAAPTSDLISNVPQ